MALSVSFVFLFFFFQSAKEWQEVFWISFVILLAGTLLFCALTSGERQEWDKTETKPTEDDIIESQSISDKN